MGCNRAPNDQSHGYREPMNDELVPESGVVVEAQLSSEPLVAAARRRVRIIGVASGSGARDHGCQDGPEELRSLEIFRVLQGADDRLCWDQTINPPDLRRDRWMRSHRLQKPWQKPYAGFLRRGISHLSSVATTHAP